jgi:hypothetical protein
MPKSKLSKSPRPVCLAAFVARLEYELAYVRADLDPSDHAVRVDVRTDHAPDRRAARPPEHRGPKPNHDETAKRVALAVNLRVVPKPPHEL